MSGLFNSYCRQYNNFKGDKDISVECEFPDKFLEDLKLYKQERSNKHVSESAKYYEPWADTSVYLI